MYHPTRSPRGPSTGLRRLFFLVDFEAMTSFEAFPEILVQVTESTLPQVSSERQADSVFQLSACLARSQSERVINIRDPYLSVKQINKLFLIQN